MRKMQNFEMYTSISQNFWDQKVATITERPVFDDEEDDELENDVHSFVDKTTHLTTAVLRKGRDVACCDERSCMSEETQHKSSHMHIIAITSGCCRKAFRKSFICFYPGRSNPCERSHCWRGDMSLRCHQADVINTFDQTDTIKVVAEPASQSAELSGSGRIRTR